MVRGDSLLAALSPAAVDTHTPRLLPSAHSSQAVPVHNVADHGQCCMLAERHTHNHCSPSLLAEPRLHTSNLGS